MTTNYTKINENIIIKILAIISFIFVTLALIVIARTSPASGYELSIYNAYPWYFWFYITTAIACGIGILMQQSFAEQKSAWWLAGLIIIIFANTIFLLLPMFRGYVFYGRGDTCSHLGYIRDILNTGHITKSNFYPIVHILGASLIQVVNMTLENIVSLFVVLFSGMYIANMYLLGKSAGVSHGQVLLTIAFTSPLIYSFFHANIHPAIISLLMVPCLLSIYQKRELLPSRRVECTILLILVSLFITFFHPVTILFVVAVFLTFGVVYVWCSDFLKQGVPKQDYQNIVGKNFLGLIQIVLVTFGIWYISFAFIVRSFKKIAQWIIFESGKPLIQSQLEPLAEANLTRIQIFELFINRYGAIFLLLLIASLAFIRVFVRCLSRKHNQCYIEVAYASQFLMAIIIGLIMLLGYFIEYNPVRIARLPLLMGTILIGLAIYEPIKGYAKINVDGKNESQQKLVRIMVLYLILILLVALSLGSVYNSPRTYSPNSQATQMEIVGTKWFEISRNPRTLISLNFLGTVDRYVTYNFGREYSFISRRPERLPSHFGYDVNNSVAEALGFKDHYIVIFGLDKIAHLYFPENIRQKVYQYNKKDFVKLNDDRTVAQIYANGEFEVWRVYGK